MRGRGCASFLSTLCTGTACSFAATSTCPRRSVPFVYRNVYYCIACVALREIPCVALPQYNRIHCATASLRAACAPPRVISFWKSLAADGQLIS